jgi:hypothetical protein
MNKAGIFNNFFGVILLIMFHYFDEVIWYSARSMMTTNEQFPNFFLIKNTFDCTIFVPAVIYFKYKWNRLIYIIFCIPSVVFYLGFFIILIIFILEGGVEFYDDF